MMAQDMPEEQMVGLVRNALLVAGYEMGETGDHWPVIKSTIYSIARDWEEAKIQRNVDAEMKIHLFQQLKILESELVNCSSEDRDYLTPRVERLRDIYDAYFSPLDKNGIAPIRDEEIPDYLKRAKSIIATLGAEDV